jgi:hypothetical protein
MVSTAHGTMPCLSRPWRICRSSSAVCGLPEPRELHWRALPHRRAASLHQHRLRAEWVVRRRRGEIAHRTDDTAGRRQIVRDERQIVGPIDGPAVVRGEARSRGVPDAVAGEERTAASKVLRRCTRPVVAARGLASSLLAVQWSAAVDRRYDAFVTLQSRYPPGSVHDQWREPSATGSALSTPPIQNRHSTLA